MLFITVPKVLTQMPAFKMRIMYAQPAGLAGTILSPKSLEVNHLMYGTNTKVESAEVEAVMHDGLGCLMLLGPLCNVQVV